MAKVLKLQFINLFQQWPLDWKCQCSSQFPRRAAPKNVQTTGQLQSSLMLVTLKILHARLQRYVMENFQMSKLGLEEAQEPKIKLPTSTGSQRKQEKSRKASTSVSLTTLMPVTGSIMTNWKTLKEMEIPDHLTYLLRNLHAGQEATLEPCMQQLTGSGLRKEYDKAVYCPPGGTSITQPRIDAFKLRC